MLEPPVKPIEWLKERIRIIDQRKLPLEEVYVDLRSSSEVAEAIKTMAIRGAPLIGVAAAFGVALEALRTANEANFHEHLEDAIDELRSTRPTATNLFWALARMESILKDNDEALVCASALEAEALRIYEEDLETGRRMGKLGEPLIKDGSALLTHCNAGGLATSGFGTALAPMYFAKAAGKRFKVFADETRPLLQGARLTAWELSKAGIDVTVVCDSAAHGLLRRGMVDVVFVGADRITTSGDFANKVGTYGLALSAKASDVPFYVVAPTSTIDFELTEGEDIPIEERSPEEVTCIGGTRLVPCGVEAFNPAFDVTPSDLVTAFITEEGMVEPPFRDNFERLRKRVLQRR